MIIYQVLPRLWGSGKFSEWQNAEFDYMKSLGVSHIWYTGLLRHASGKEFVKGNAGSPYAISDVFDLNPYLADNPENRLEEFDALVGRVHKAGLKLIMDFVPNHLAADYNGDIPVCTYHDYDWSDTVKIDYSKPAARSRMTESVRYWAARGVDGFRVDMAELVPRDFLCDLIRSVKRDFPSVIFIGEVYTRENYRTYLLDIGFDYLYDKSGLYDILQQRRSAREITWNWQGLGDLQPRVLNFLENHDEQRLPRPDYAALAVSSSFNKAPFMLYFAQEVGENASDHENRRTSIFDFEKIDSVEDLRQYIISGRGLPPQQAETLQRHRSILRLAKEVNDCENYDLCYLQRPEFGWNADRHFAFCRFRENETVLAVCNFGDDPVRLTIVTPWFPNLEVSAGAHDVAISILPIRGK